MTKAEFARRVAGINAVVGRHLSELVAGMWNPDFCSDDADYDVEQFIESIEIWLTNLKNQRDRPSRVQPSS